MLVSVLGKYTIGLLIISYNIMCKSHLYVCEAHGRLYGGYVFVPSCLSYISILVYMIFSEF